MSIRQRDYPLRVGAAGWEHPGWAEAFYPGDLPPDWRLAYYANEFPVVMIPAAQFATAGPADVAVWQEAAETGMGLLCELDAERPLAAQTARAGELGEGCLGLVLPVTEPGHTFTQLDRLGESPPVVVDFGSARPQAAIRESLAARGVGWCWHGEGPAEGLAPGPLAVIRAPAQGLDLRRLRGWLEAGLAVQDGQRDVVMVLEGTPPPIDVLRQAQTLLELM